MVLNATDPLGPSLVTQKEGACLILWSPVLLEHLFPLALTEALS